MDLFGMGGGKKGSSVDAWDYGSDQVGMMNILAGMPHMMRKPMMKGSINQLLALSEEKRQESVRDMIGAFNSSKIKAKSREKLVATRVEILGELPEEKRRTVITSRVAALKVAPQLYEADQQVQERPLGHVSAEARAAFTATWKHVTQDNGA